MMPAMSTVQEIETAIQKLPEPQLAELVAWLEQFRAPRATPATAENWLEHARGAAQPGVTTAQIMKLTRGEP